MEQERDFRKLLVKANAKNIADEVQKLLYDDYLRNEDISPEEVWGINNELTVEGFSAFFDLLKKEKILNTSLVLHYSITNVEEMHSEINTRIILYDGLKPVYVDFFDELIDEDKYEYKGLIRKGFEKLVQAVLMYEEYEEVTLEDVVSTI